MTIAEELRQTLTQEAKQLIDEWLVHVKRTAPTMTLPVVKNREVQYKLLGLLPTTKIVSEECELAGWPLPSTKNTVFVLEDGALCIEYEMEQYSFLGNLQSAWDEWQRVPLSSPALSLETLASVVYILSRTRA